MPGAGQRLGVERRVELLDVEAVLAPEAWSARLAAAATSGPMPCPARQATTYLRRAVISVLWVWDGKFTVVLLSLDAPSGRTGGVVSLGVCARPRARERRSPLERGESR